MTPRLLVIDPSVSFPEQLGVSRVVRLWPGEIQVLRPALSPGDGLNDDLGYGFTAAVLMGSRASVHDPLAWIDDLARWLKPILSGEVWLPLLGICFGHQLISHVAGGRVGFVHTNRAKVLGVFDSVLQANRLVGPCTLRVAASHCEQVETVPAGFRRFASRGGVRIDGLEHERAPVFGVQFHPEAGEEFLRRRGAEVSAEDALAVDRDSDRVFGGFYRMALGAGGEDLVAAPRERMRSADP